MRRRSLLALCAAGLTGPALARKLYRYRDSAGNWHFTDIPPAPTQEASVSELQPGRAEPALTVETETTASGEILHLLNTYAAPVQVELSLRQSTNTLTEPALPYRFLVPAGERGRLRSHPILTGVPVAALARFL